MTTPESRSLEERLAEALGDALDAMMDTEEADGLRPEWWEPYEWAAAQAKHLPVALRKHGLVIVSTEELERRMWGDSR